MRRIQAIAQAEFIYYVIDAYKKQCKKYGAENMKKTGDGINFAIRGLDKVLGANYSSQKVIDVFGKDALKGLMWNKLAKHKDGKVKMYHFEHAYTVSTMKRELVNNSFTQEEAVEFILSNYACCWITSEENIELNKAGFNSKRPNGWKNSYESVGIKVVKLDDDDL
jgi:hypothetical protein